MSIELLQVMSAFYARSAFKFIELLPWLLLSFGEQFEVRVVPVALSMIVRWSRKNPAYHSQLERLKRWKACNREIETCSRRIERLKLRAIKIERLKLLCANIIILPS